MTRPRDIKPRLGQLKDATTQGLSSRYHYGQRMEVDERILMMAEAEYERQFPPGQTIDRLRQRGGLGYTEMVMLLAYAVARYAPEDALIPKSLTRPEP